jgi:hypothetical protein
MDDSTILNIDAMPDPDRIDIATDDSTPPNGALITENHITNDHRIVRKKTLLTELWKHIVYAPNDSHKY